MTQFRTLNFIKINVLTKFDVDAIKTVPSRGNTSKKLTDGRHGRQGRLGHPSRTSRTSRTSTRRTDEGHHSIPKAHPEHAQVS